MKYTTSTRIFLVSIFIIILNCFAPSAFAQDGKGVFQANCAQCHSVGKGVVIGPDLKDVDKRRPTEWIHKWVKSSKSVIASGDSYAVALYAKFNKTEMPNQNVTDAEIDAVLTYIKSVKVETPKTPALGAEPTEEPTNWLLDLTIAVIVLWILAYALAKVKIALKHAALQKQGLPIEEELSFFKKIGIWMKGHKKAVALMIVALMVFGSVQAWYALAGIGISQGYQPDQPIAFSHKIHAGENGISCIYCHSGAERGKTAGIPSANVCMNCHKAIKSGTTTGTEEIAKIYKALDYNPDTQTYGDNPQPLKWVRVHNLPDFAYFNHSQHVVVGGQKCQTCHGPVEEMTVAKQFSPLTMGWCIDCHRNTEVKMEGNHYYDDYHKKLMDKYGKDAKITVEKIGGTECGRCHY